MVKITGLQSFIQLEKNLSSNVLTLFGIPGSGMNTVFDEISKFDASDIYIHINPENIGEINELNAIKNLLFEIANVLDQKKAVKLKEEYDQKGDFYYYSTKLRELVKSINSDRRIFIILDGFQKYLTLDKYFFQVIKTIIELSGDKRNQLKVVFGVEQIYSKEEFYKKLGDLAPYFLKNTEFVCGFEISEIAEVLKTAVKDNMSVAKKIFMLSAGSANITDIVLDMISVELRTKNTFILTEDFLKKVTENIEIDYITHKILESININLGDFKLLINSKNINIDSLYLNFYLGTGLLITDRDGNINIQSILIQNLLSSISHLNISKKSVEQLGVININTDELSTQEFEIYNLFKSKKGQLVTKNEIGKIMWGEVKSGRKKDWAIDQLMKRLRSKIGDNNGQLLQTVRGRGYRMDV